jgi:hypothetical protein
LDGTIINLFDEANKSASAVGPLRSMGETMNHGGGPRVMAMRNEHTRFDAAYIRSDPFPTLSAATKIMSRYRKDALRRFIY